MSLYQAEMAKPGTLDDRDKVIKLYVAMAQQHKSMSKFYERIGERMQMRRKVVVKGWMVSMALVMAVIGLLVIAPVRGLQEVTPPVVVDDVVEVTPPVVVVDPPVVEQPPDVVVIEQPDGTFKLAEFLGGIVTGVFVTLGGIFGVIGRYRDNTPALNAIEWLGKSAPPDVIQTMNQMSINMMHAAEVLNKITDGLPNEPGPQAVYSKRVITGAEERPLPEDGELG